MTAKSSRSPIEDYVKEVLADLDTLIAMYPQGIYVAHLTDYYGESINRTIRACQILSLRYEVQYLQAASKAYYILPNGYVPPRKLHNLSPLQAKLVQFIDDSQQKSSLRRVATNYSQLARILSASFGGIRACLHRCEELGYLTVHSQSARGHQRTLILSANIPATTTTTTTTTQDHKKTS